MYNRSSPLKAVNHMAMPPVQHDNMAVMMILYGMQRYFVLKMQVNTITIHGTIIRMKTFLQNAMIFISAICFISGILTTDVVNSMIT